MRETKFRGKRKDNGEWVYGSAMIWNGAAQIFVHHCMLNNIWQIDKIRVIPETVGQYTGLKDKHLSELWEGDLREIDGKLYKLVDDGWRLRFERNLFEFGENKDIIVDEDTAYMSTLRGNIYEHPELLNK